ncbi:MAG TPA: CoA ester lyase [bacterium]|nr:CoA ester lyase [bacterium]
MTGVPWVLRSLLFVPGHRADMIAKASRSGADAIILDLEDGVAPEAKAEARRVIGSALDAGLPGAPIVWLRVNGAASGLLEVDLREGFRPGLAGVCLPKCEAGEDVLTVDAHLRTLEARHGLPLGGTWLLPMVESARGVVQASAIARCHPRVWGMGFGAEDYTADLGVVRTRQGEEIAYPRAAVSVAAHAAHIEAVDGIYADFRDAEGLRADTAASRRLGYTGKMVIHPAQVALVHGVFAPGPEEIAHARRVVTAFEEARSRGAGVVVVDGAMVDRPVVLRAQRTLAIADRSSPASAED